MVWWLLQIKGQLLANISNKWTQGVFAITTHILFIFEIFKILLASSTSWSSDLIEYTEKA